MSTQFAPVCPLPIARQLARVDPEAFGNYHLVIATEVMKDPLGYHEFWAGREGTLILDNGVIEEGAAVDIRLLAAAATLVRASIVIIPDVIADCDATIQSARTNSMPLRRLLPQRTELMGVIQAQTVEEANLCQLVFDEQLIDWTAVPKGYRERNVGSRAALAHSILARHILGFSNTYDFDDDAAAAQAAGGIDAATPIWMGAVGLTMDKASPEIPRPKDYWSWKELPPPQLDRAIFNIRTVRSWLNARVSEPLR